MFSPNLENFWTFLFKNFSAPPSSWVHICRLNIVPQVPAVLSVYFISFLFLSVFQFAMSQSSLIFPISLSSLFLNQSSDLILNILNNSLRSSILFFRHFTSFYYIHLSIYRTFMVIVLISICSNSIVSVTSVYISNDWYFWLYLLCIAGIFYGMPHITNVRLSSVWILLSFLV